MNLLNSFLIIESSSNVLSKDENDSLVIAFNNCISEISMLRKLHLGIATRYLSVTKKGTGTSTFRILLKECIKDTDETKIETHKMKN